MIEFASNGGTDRGYLASPSTGAGPGVVVIQEWWGLVPHITDVCDRFAAEGFVALAPDLYRGVTVAEPDEAQKTMMGLHLEQAGRDMSGAVDEVARRSSTAGIGVVGFCMGGGLALVLGCQRPDKVRGVVAYYGVIPWPEAQPDYSAMTAATQGHYATDDDFAGPEAARALEAHLSQMGKQVEMFVYPDTAHGFFNDSRPHQYSPEASALAWDRTVSFLREGLK